MLRCRLCLEAIERTFVDLGMSPLSNGYLTREGTLEPELFYPLKVFVCESCFLVQLPESESRENIFAQDYRYFSSYSQSWLEHCEKYAHTMIERWQLKESHLVVELASNDGYLLQFFQRRGIPVLGIDPARNVAAVAIDEKQIPTVIEFFGISTARRLVAEGRTADVIVANNVLAHVPDLHDFLGGIKILLKSDGVCTIEFPHLVRLIDANQFDTIYHEHFSYFTLHSAAAALARHQLEVFDVERLPTHGGSLRLFVRHRTGSTGPAVQQLLAEEAAAGFTSMRAYAHFEARVNRVKRDLLTALIGAKHRGKSIAAYGAAAKGNTLLNYCGIRTDLVDFVADANPHKQGLFLPGTHIPIHPPEWIGEERPDYILVLPWNLKNEIVDQLGYTREWGAQFMIAVPTLQVM